MEYNTQKKLQRGICDLLLQTVCQILLIRTLNIHMKYVVQKSKVK